MLRDSIPELTITVFGCTSSGKSTLVNLLAGRWILPTAVQQSPRVVIELHHDDVAGVHLENHVFHTGGEIRRTIEQRTLQLITTQSGGAPIVLKCTTSLGLVPPRANFWQRLFGRKPNGTFLCTRRLCLRDTPGMLCVADQSALETFDRIADGSFLIIVLNAVETNDLKEDHLIRHVCHRVACTDQDWNRLVFVLNRIDEYYPSWLHSLNRYYQNIRERIVNIARSEGWHAAEEQLQLHCIAAYPSLLCEVLTGPLNHEIASDWEAFTEIAVGAFAGKLADEQIAHWPLSPAAWTHETRSTLRDLIFHRFGWYSFRRALCHLIQNWLTTRQLSAERLVSSQFQPITS